MNLSNKVFASREGRGPECTQRVRHPLAGPARTQLSYRDSIGNRNAEVNESVPERTNNCCRARRFEPIAYLPLDSTHVDRRP